MINVVRVKLDDGAYMPERAHGTDAGADLRCMEDITVYADCSAVIDTGVHVQLPQNTCGLLVAKSGLNINFDLLTTGLIDEGFSGSIKVKVYNHGDRPYVFHKGDKVSQLVILPVYYADFVRVDEIESGLRGENGYGSTGK